MSGLEFELVEWPAVQQLQALGWGHLSGDTWEPALTERESWRDVVLEGRLRAALKWINLDATGEPWLDERRVSQAVSSLQKAGAGGLKLIDANRKATDLLLTGTTVPGMEWWGQGRDQMVRFIDWENWANNDFLVINQFRVDEPGGQSKQFICPDLVLFVNGIPLVVVECKAPGPEDAIARAITQLRRYSNRRGEVDADEGNESLFWANQFVVGTTFEAARVGTFTSGPEHFLEWKDPYPLSEAVPVSSGVAKRVEDLSGQESLIAGMLRPESLLDIVRHFTLFMPVGQRTVKAVTRYQQFRSVHRAIDRLKTGKTRAEDGEVDQRGGVIWHTQGSGKSLTIVFLVRKMRSDPELRRFKVVVVSDRTALQKQLRDTAELSGETVAVARRTRHLKTLLAQSGPGLVMAMIQKYRDEIAVEPGLEEDETADGTFGVLNDDDAILVMVDEAHRSHASGLHANLMAALPNAARVGFTGTPIIMGARKKTHDIFGPFLDTYTLAESEADGSTVPILYEGRTADGAVKGASDMDELFFRWFAGLTAEQRDALQAKYARVAEVLEAPEMISAKAADMLEHYVATVLPQGLKGMVVASSRRACIRYRDAFNAARDLLVSHLENLDPALAGMSGDEIDDLPRRQQFLVRALPHIDLIRILEFVPVISGAHNDSADWATWTDKDEQDSRIEAFKKPLGPDADKTSPVAMLIVKSMLLTGFDAPVAQVLFLDRLIQQAELLQAVARVNRTADGKDYGLVVDYYGVVNHLTEALAAYADADGKLDDLAAGSLRSIAEEAGRLSDRHQRVVQFLAGHGIDLADDPGVIELCVDLFGNPELRARFDIDVKRFLVSLDIVLPRPEARPFVADAKLFGKIQLYTRLRYRDQGNGGFDPSLYREKVRQLIDEHITVLDLAQAIPPIRITDVDFKTHVAGQPSERAKASEMEHALRHHILEKYYEDPARYKKLSERLDEVLDALEGKWDQLALAIGELIDDATADRETDATGLDEIDLRFLGVIEDELGEAAVARDQMIEVTTGLVDMIRRRVRTVGFWGNANAQDELRKQVVQRLDESRLYPLDHCKRVADRLIELSKANHQLLVTT
ncbi:MAG: HsdR family type I site-specific deoxyribonuclease [Acidimicrobiia bacterium]|nr:HsdR family type I site-specific deoxyribonuclease [Acidimicrobiia bacterium]